MLHCFRKLQFRQEAQVTVGYFFFLYRVSVRLAFA